MITDIFWFQKNKGCHGHKKYITVKQDIAKLLETHFKNIRRDLRKKQGKWILTNKKIFEKNSWEFDAEY